MIRKLLNHVYKLITHETITYSLLHAKCQTHVVRRDNPPALSFRQMVIYLWSAHRLLFLSPGFCLGLFLDQWVP